MLRTSTITTAILSTLLVSDAFGLAMTDASGGSAAHDNIQPSLAINFLVNTGGAFEDGLGDIIVFGGNFAPSGYAQANGQLIDITQNPGLFALLGTTYGGDGRTTFALPDLRGRTPVHYGQGPGLSNWRIGERRGSETEMLSIAEMASHQHSLPEEPPNGVPVPGVHVLLLAGLFGLLRSRRQLRIKS